MKSATYVLVLFLSLIATARCEADSEDPIRVYVGLDRMAICPGEPLRILLCCEVKDEVGGTYTLSGGENPWAEYVPQIWVSDPMGKPVPNRMKPERLVRVFSIFNRLRQGTKYLFPFELHRWCTTDLPPGKYLIHLDRVCIEYAACTGSDSSVGPGIKGVLVLPKELDFTILEPNPDKVDQIYKTLCERMLSYRELPASDRQLAKFDINLLVHALGRSAAKYQLQLLLQSSPYVYSEVWYEERIFNGFMSCPSLATAQGLGKYYNENAMATRSTSTEVGICHVMTAYSVCQDEAVRHFAEDFLKKYPEAREIASRPIWDPNDGGGWTDGIGSSVLELPSDSECVFPQSGK